MKSLSTIIAFLLISSISGLAQQDNASIARGNEYYQRGEYDKSIEAYRKALQQNPSSIIASYNLANAMHRKGQYPEAENLYEDIIGSAGTREKMLQKVQYNNGVNFTRQKLLAESIESYKKAVLLDPSDEDARFNLQKALEELRKQNQPKDQPQQQQKQKDKPPPQSKLNKKQMEQYLKSLRQKEQEVQQKMQSRSRSVTQPEKDW